MGAGFARLNALTIIQTSQGLAEHLLASSPNTQTAGIVVGYDARHNSKRFAELAAGVFESKGIIVWWFEDIVHTPLVPYAVKHKKAAAGIMITASHNPAQDNGYKVYGSNGCQILSPVDHEIVRSILQNLEPTVWESQGSFLRKPILEPMKANYLASIVHRLNLTGDAELPVHFVYTPMHGVGLRYIAAMIDTTNFKGTMTVVKEQAQPDPDFSTVRYPNPEEIGALDLAMKTGDAANISLVLANDPDGDRFAVAEKSDGVWHQFTGDQVGILLAYWLLPVSRNTVMLTTAVSSQMLSFIAEAEDFSSQETLTGFKWLGKATQDLQVKGKEVQFAYEEALGYMFPDIVYDKDGIAAASIFLRACSSWGSPWAKLQELFTKYGFFATTNTYWRSPNIRKTEVVLQCISDLENPFPKKLVYLECRGQDQASAEKGALEMLRWIRHEWFNDPELMIDEKFAHV
ncbi:MAG: hypothetical protein Q9219_001024 [cf. Caloplaca sp. 3 TL-2023]